MKTCDQMEKGILRRALAGVLPGDVLKRRKSPYPKSHNPAYLETVRAWLLRILDDPTSPLLQLVNEREVRRLAQSDGVEFDRPWFGQLMRGPQLFAFLAQVDTWLRQYKVVLC
jgi:asparagine synthase (glutamine-hydrolysing)